MLVYCFLILMCFSALFFLLLALPRRRARWRKYRMLHYVRRGKPAGMMSKLLWFPPSDHRIVMYSQLLAGCGIQYDTSRYLIIKRHVMISSVFLGTLTYTTWLMGLFASYMYMVSAVSLCLAIWLLCAFDTRILHMIRRKRRERIVQEVYILSRQLLYYSGSKMNLHSKLKHCLPFTTTLRNDMELLIREWYEGAEIAINKFKLRLGTEEGMSFVETINALQMHESERYYELLRQRIQDYKEKIELDKESRKEAHSYILFTLAGLPIMNTFRVFIYPWVQEGQKLFETLG